MVSTNTDFMPTERSKRKPRYVDKDTWDAHIVRPGDHLDISACWLLSPCPPSRQGDRLLLTSHLRDKLYRQAGHQIAAGGSLCPQLGCDADCVRPAHQTMIRSRDTESPSPILSPPPPPKPSFKAPKPRKQTGCKYSTEAERRRANSDASRRVYWRRKGFEHPPDFKPRRYIGEDVRAEVLRKHLTGQAGLSIARDLGLGPAHVRTVIRRHRREHGG